MKSSEYVQFVSDKLMKIDPRQQLVMCALGASGEAAELTEAVQADGFDTIEKADSELGDVLFYVTGCALLLAKDGVGGEWWLEANFQRDKYNPLPTVYASDEQMCLDLLKSTGSLAEAVKKYVFHNKGTANVVKAVESVFLSIHSYCITMEIKLDLVMQANYGKLTDRYGNAPAPSPKEL